MSEPMSKQCDAVDKDKGKNNKRCPNWMRRQTGKYQLCRWHLNCWRHNEPIKMIDGETLYKF